MGSGKYLFVRVLEACNADCFMCGFALSRDSFRLAPPQFVKILEQAASMGVSYVRFTGGEPLMHKEIQTLITVASDFSTKVSLITNGYHLAAMAADLAEAGLGQVIVSIDSADPTEHDLYRNTPGLFARAVRGIEEAIGHSIIARVNSVVGPHNYQTMPALGRALRDLGVAQWELSALKLDAAITYPNRDHVLAIGEEVYSGGGLVPMGKRWYGDTDIEQDRYFDHGIPPRASGPICRVIDDVMYLDAKGGFMFPCSLLPHRSVPALYGAQVRQTEGNYVLDSPDFQERRSFFRENGSNICTGCSSSAAGYSDLRSRSTTELPAWSY
jgi:cytosylglucuronate decarboxylase